MIELTDEDIDIVKKYGTKIISVTSRFVIPLDKLNEPFLFVNPKDANKQYGYQILKGDGNDILLFNELSSEQIIFIENEIQTFEDKINKPITDINKNELEIFLSLLKNKGINDIYCSDKKYLEHYFIAENCKKRVGVYTKNKTDICYGVVIPIGTVYKSKKKEQIAKVEGALFIVNADDNYDNARITNRPEDYKSVQDMIIITLFEAKKAQSES